MQARLQCTLLGTWKRAMRPRQPLFLMSPPLNEQTIDSPGRTKIDSSGGGGPTAFWALPARALHYIMCALFPPLLWRALWHSTAAVPVSQFLWPSLPLSQLL